MSLRLAALWFDGSPPVVKVGVDSAPPLRAAANLASNTPTPHVPDKGRVQACKAVCLLDRNLVFITMAEVAKVSKSMEFMFRGLKHLQTQKLK